MASSYPTGQNSSRGQNLLKIIHFLSCFYDRHIGKMINQLSLGKSLVGESGGILNRETYPIAKQGLGTYSF